MGQESTSSLGSWIRANRKRLDWTQAELSRLLEVSHGTVCHWEKGKAVPRQAHRSSYFHPIKAISAETRNNGTTILTRVESCPSPERKVLYPYQGI